MSRPQTTFDQPQFSLIPDDTERQYANVSNRLEFMKRENGPVHYKTVVVPAHLFTIMKDIFKVPRDDDVELYLQRDGEFFVFGMIWGENDAADLWLYTFKELPGMFK